MRITDEEVINPKTGTNNLPEWVIMILALSQSRYLNCKSLFVETGVVAFVNNYIKERWKKKSEGPSPDVVSRRP